MNTPQINTIRIRECPSCEGDKYVPCDCNCPYCTDEEPCDYCDSTGLDPNQVDTNAWKFARDEFDSTHQSTYDWKSGEVYLGRQVFEKEIFLSIVPFILQTEAPDQDRPLIQ